MIDVLDIIKGAVSTKDLVPVLRHVAIHEGRICAFNGNVYIDAPAPSALAKMSCTVEADRFYAAVGTDKNTEVRMVEEPGAHRMEIKTGRMTATLPVGKIEEYPLQIALDEKRKKLKGSLLPTLRALRPFIGEDGSRLWACGIMFMAGVGRATNNVVIAQTDPGVGALLHPTPFNLPVVAVDELLRLSLEPIHYCLQDNAITFYLPGNVRVRTNLIQEPWPESAHELIWKLHGEAKLRAIPSELCEAVERVTPFCQHPRTPVVRFEESKVCTTGAPMRADVEGFEGLGTCAFRAEPLLKMLQIATHADWSAFPRVPWKGQGLKGVIVGVML